MFFSFLLYFSYLHSLILNYMDSFAPYRKEVPKIPMFLVKFHLLFGLWPIFPLKFQKSHKTLESVEHQMIVVVVAGNSTFINDFWNFLWPLNLTIKSLLHPSSLFDFKKSRLFSSKYFLFCIYPPKTDAFKHQLVIELFLDNISRTGSF